MAVQTVALLLLISLIDQARASTYRNNDAGLTAVPTNIPTTSDYVYLTGNQLPTISNSDFSLLTQLQYLYLTANNITSISPNAFDSTPLKLLHLSSNPIKTVPFFQAIDATLSTLYMSECQISSTSWDQVVPYSNLVRLLLGTNQLTTCPDVTKSARTLKQLDLAFNSIETLDAEKLDGCNELSWISVQSNGLKRVNGVLELPELNSLVLLGNALDQFPDISRLPLLEYLSLSSNPIQVVPNDSFVNNLHLSNIVIYDNQLSHMPDLDETKNSLKKLTISSPKITSVPTDYFRGFSKLIFVNFTGNSISSIAFVRSIGLSVETLYLTSNQITNLSSGFFINATGLRQLNLDSNKITDFDMSILQKMPQLRNLDLSGNQLKRAGNAYTYCSGVSCTRLTIDLKNNSIPCDSHLCWAKLNTTITVQHDNCSGTLWDDVTVSDLECPVREQVMKLEEKRGFAGTFENYEFMAHGYKKTKLEQMVFMKCVGTCLTTDGCHYFKHGNRTHTNGIDHKDMQDCAIWIFDP